MLQNISYTPLEELSINIGPIHHGWMDIDICDGVTNYSYIASYTTDPLNDLLNATVYALTNTPYTDKIGNKLHNYFIIDHDLENRGNIYWIFEIQNNKLLLTIWDNPPEELIEFWDSYCDISSIAYDNLQFSFPVLPKPIFAHKGETIIFAKKLQSIINELAVRDRDEKDFDGWGYEFAKERVEILSSFIKDNPPPLAQ